MHGGARRHACKCAKDSAKTQCATGSASQPKCAYPRPPLSLARAERTLTRTHLHSVRRHRNHTVLLRRATIVLGTASTVTTTAYLIWFVEKYSPLGFDTFEQALWCTIITMSTVGYGDIYPVSLPGRIIMTLGGILGGTLTAGLITTVFVDLAILTENERRVLHVLDNQAVRSVACAARTPPKRMPRDALCSTMRSIV